MNPKVDFVTLIILDGWGLAPPGKGNAISLAKTPTMDRFFNAYPHSQIQACGRFVGLSEGEAGSSEVGHLTIGAGSIIFQDISRIDLSVSDGSFLKNKAFVQACEFAKKNQSNLHFLGLFGSGKIHSSREHLYALLELCKKQNFKKEQVKLHLFTDGRDSAPTAAKTLIKELEEKIEELEVGEIASISGRYWAMDRDRRWERTKKAYRLLTESVGERGKSAEAILEKNYQKQITDEFIPPSLIENDSNPEENIIKEKDALIFFNFRTDRMRQLAQAFLLDDFHFFKNRKKLKEIFTTTMTEFEKDLPVSEVAFRPHPVDFALPRVLSAMGMKQLHIAETEKYAFVTYYFNGLYEKKVSGEKRIVVPSPRVATYDKQPEMSAREITEAFKTEIRRSKYHFVVINFANADMLGHTGNIQAAIKACETIDQSVKEVANTTLALNGACLITADHGNADEMIDPKTGKTSTSHSSNPVPLILLGKPFEKLQKKLLTGSLADIAPTILKILNITIPSSMKGRPVF